MAALSRIKTITYTDNAKTHKKCYEGIVCKVLLRIKFTRLQFSNCWHYLNNCQSSFS